MAGKENGPFVANFPTELMEQDRPASGKLRTKRVLLFFLQGQELQVQRLHGRQRDADQEHDGGRVEARSQRELPGRPRWCCVAARLPSGLCVVA